MLFCSSNHSSSSFASFYRFALLQQNYIENRFTETQLHFWYLFNSSRSVYLLLIRITIFLLFLSLKSMFSIFATRSIASCTIFQLHHCAENLTSLSFKIQFDQALNEMKWRRRWKNNVCTMYTQFITVLRTRCFNHSLIQIEIVFY